MDYYEASLASLVFLNAIAVQRLEPFLNENTALMSIGEVSVNMVHAYRTAFFFLSFL